MDERRKIVIPIGDDSDSKSEQTFFDTQSRKDARPVVPLSGTSTTGPPVRGTRSRKSILLVVIVVAVVAAAGSALAYSYMSQSRGKDGPQAAVQPVAEKAPSALTWTRTQAAPVAKEDADETRRANDAIANVTPSRVDGIGNDGDPKKAGKQQKRGKSNKNNADDTDDPVKRTQDELHRIRDIFEGPPE